MEDVGLWPAYDPQPLQHAGMFNGTESQASLLSYHAESPYPQYWPHEPFRTDEISDITLMPATLVDSLEFDPVLTLPAVPGETLHGLAGGGSKFAPQGHWGHTLGSADFYPTQEVQDILNTHLISFNAPSTTSPHLHQDFNTSLNNNKPFGTIVPMQQTRPVSTNAPPAQYEGPSSIHQNNRAVGSGTAPVSQYGGSSGGPNSMGMLPPRIINPSSMDAGCHNNSNNTMAMLQHLPKRYHLCPAPKTGGNVTVTSDGGGIPSVPGTSTFVTNQKSLLPELHARDSVAPEEPKMASFNPGPYVNSSAVPPTAKPHEQNDAHRMWLGKSNAMPIPNTGHRHSIQQAMSNSSPVTSLGYDQRHQLAVSNSSPVTSMSFEQRHQQAMSNSSPVTSMPFDHRHRQAMSNSSPVPSMGSRHQKSMSGSSPATRMVFDQQQRSKQPMTNSSPIPTIVGFEPTPQHQSMTSSSAVPIMTFEQQRQQQHHQQHQQPMAGSSPIQIRGFEPQRQQQQQQPMSTSSSNPNLVFEQQRQQPTVSSSPPSTVSYEPGQPPPPQIGSPPSSSNPVFEPRRQPPIGSSSNLPNLARQQQQQQPAAASNVPRSAVPDPGESAPKWSALRMVGGSVPGSEKAPIMRQQPETGTIKCALPRSTGATVSPVANANPVNKRPLWPDDNKNPGGSMTKKPVQKWQGAAGCSRLEEISAAAHQKVTQNSSGRALGPALNTNLKPRARQGSANDPQSIAARVRRERISERLKVLQTLIPNGDKVDMVTMLEKAINYVQCLELQIRMLKNDSLWPKALDPLPNTLQELLELAGPEFLGGKDGEETPEKATEKKAAPEVIEFDGNQPSADKE